MSITLDKQASVENIPVVDHRKGVDLAANNELGRFTGTLTWGEDMSQVTSISGVFTFNERGAEVSCWSFKVDEDSDEFPYILFVD